MAKKKATEGKKALAETATRPNRPSFDFDPETGEPNIVDGETVLVRKTKDGVPVYVTDAGRVIFVCSIEEYETKFHALIKRNVFEFYYPNACKKVKKFKLIEEPVDEKSGAPKTAAAATANKT